MSRRPPRVLETDWAPIVAGTHDVEEARRIIARDADQFCGCWPPNREVHDCTPAAEDAKITWLRVVPGCPEWCGEGHNWHWLDAEPSSRGAFKAVEWPGLW